MRSGRPAGRRAVSRRRAERHGVHPRRCGCCRALNVLRAGHQGRGRAGVSESTCFPIRPVRALHPRRCDGRRRGSRARRGWYRGPGRLTAGGPASTGRLDEGDPDRGRYRVSPACWSGAGGIEPPGSIAGRQSGQRSGSTWKAAGQGGPIGGRVRAVRLRLVGTVFRPGVFRAGRYRTAGQAPDGIDAIAALGSPGDSLSGIHGQARTSGTWRTVRCRSAPALRIGSPEG